MAGRGSSARRYAEAAFDLAVRDDAVADWLEQLERAAELTSSEQLDKALGNPAIPFQDRLRVLESALDRDAPKPLRNLVGLLLRRGRIELLPAVAAEFRRLHRRREGITIATVTSAMPLRDEEIQAITERLERQTGGRVELELEVDPGILGGLLVRLGDLLLDGSVRGRLERLRSRLIAGAV